MFQKLRSFAIAEWADRAASRITGIHHRTLIQIVLAAGERCEKLLSSRIKNVPVEDVQCDEIWGFVQKKQSNRRGDEADFAYVGDAWIFVAIERNSKLVLAYDLGKRTVSAASRLMGKFADATDPRQRFQLTTDEQIGAAARPCRAVERWTACVQLRRWHST